MSSTLSLKELRKMSLSDLSQEINSLSNEVAKLRLGIALGKEKNTALLSKGRKQLAKMKTVRSERRENVLPKTEKANTVSPASAAA